MRTISFSAMDLTVRAAVLTDSPNAARALDFTRAGFAHYQRALDRRDPTSELSELNHAHGQPLRVSPLLFRAVRTALAASAATGNLYDPMIVRRTPDDGRPLSLRRTASTPLSGAAVATVSRQVDARIARAPAVPAVLVDAVRGTVEVPAGVELDLTDIASGLAADAAALRSNLVTGFRIDAGSDARVGNADPDSPPWQVAVPDPCDAGGALAMLLVRDGAVATRTPELMARRHAAVPGHPLAQIGTGAASGPILSATVVASTLAGAQVFAHAAVLAGPTAAMRLLETRCIAGLLALRGGDVLVTERMWPYLQR